jgi:DNA-binding NarL/FixJ family response regulator
VVGGEASSGTDALQMINGDFDLLLLDMNMPGINGVELISLAQKSRPGLPIIVFSMHNQSHVAINAINAGASGYFSKNSDPKLLLDAIRKVGSGQQYLDPNIAETLVFSGNTPEQKLAHSLLSPREHEIFKLLSAGNSVKKIAEQLSISNKTVSAHKANLMDKMKLKTLVDIVRYADSNDLNK